MNLKLFIFSIFAVSTLNSALPDHTLCTGIMEENDLYIPVSKTFSGGITESEFNAALDRIDQVFSPVIAKQGGRLSIQRLWQDGTVNASAHRSGQNYIINMYGGLARYHVNNIDSFLLVACHEIGHHIGGAPKVSRFGSSWASNEGQSDTFAGLKCLRQVYSKEENVNWALQAEIHPLVAERCQNAWYEEADQAACMRFAMAARRITEMFREIKFPNDTLDFTTPDSAVVSQTDDGHPRPQCRLDTYLAAALCPAPINEPFSENDPLVGNCTRRLGLVEASRPLCWYKP